MRSLFLSLCLISLPALAATPLEAVTGSGSEVAQRMVELAVKQEVPATDARVIKAREHLVQAMKATGETEQAIAAACTRAARFIFDATKSPATSVEVLEALATYGKGKPMSDTIGRYVEVRRNAAGRTHAEAMAALK